MVFNALTAKLSFSSLGDNGMTAPCNVNCSCSLATINPVCGEDNLAYFSPCHAGCKVSQDEKVIERKYLLCLVKLDCTKPLTMLAVLLGSCVSARLMRATGLREEWHGRSSYLLLPFPILTICRFVTYDLSLHIRIRNCRDAHWPIKSA